MIHHDQLGATQQLQEPLKLTHRTRGSSQVCTSSNVLWQEWPYQNFGKFKCFPPSQRSKDWAAEVIFTPVAEASPARFLIPWNADLCSYSDPQTSCLWNSNFQRWQWPKMHQWLQLCILVTMTTKCKCKYPSLYSNGNFPRHRRVFTHPLSGLAPTSTSLRRRASCIAKRQVHSRATALKVSLSARHSWPTSGSMQTSQ